MKNRRGLLQVVRLALAFAGSFLWVTPQANGGPAARPVYVSASFRDQNGLFIGNLDKSEVQIFEDGQPRALEFMAKDELPAVYGVIFDMSVLSDVQEQRQPGFIQASAGTTLRDLAYGLIDKYLGRQSVWAGGYDQGLTIQQDVTTDGFRVKDALQRLTGRSGPDEPFLFSALASAVEKMSARPERRRVLLVFMGLADLNTSGRTKVLKNLLSGSNIEALFFSCASKLGSPGGGVSYNLSEAFVRELGATTSGESYFLRPGEEHVGDTLTRVVNQISNLYTLGFESTSTIEKPAKLVIKCSRDGARVKHHREAPVLD
jgi:hypothetical protein